MVKMRKMVMVVVILLVGREVEVRSIIMGSVYTSMPLMMYIKEKYPP